MSWNNVKTLGTQISLCVNGSSNRHTYYLLYCIAYIIDLNHQPNDYTNEEKSGVDLVLSGHSHGGQIIPLGIIGKLIKENEEYYGLHKRGNTTFIVNSGMSNWAMSFKTGTKSEYSVITIRSTYEENSPL